MKYIGGRRNLYTKPIALFFIVNLIYFIAQPVDTFYTGLYSQTHYQSYSEITTELTQNKLDSLQIEFSDLIEKYDKVALDYSKTLIILFVILFSLPLALLFWSKRQFYYNHLIFSLSYVTFLLFGLLLVLSTLSAVIFKIYYWISGTELQIDANGNAFTIFLLTIIFFWLLNGLRTFYDQKLLWTIPKAILLTIGTIGTIVAYRFIMFFIIINLI